jgi:hypothetical protein
LNPFQPKYIGVGGDANGLVPSLLRESLQAKWKPEDASNPASDIPKVSLFAIKVTLIYQN